MPKPYEYQDEQRYDIDLDKIPKPDPIKRQYAYSKNDSILYFVNNANKANYFVLSAEEYNKINALKELAISYRQIIESQESLINTKIEKNNLLQEQMKLERDARIIATEGWKSSENLYREEKKDREYLEIMNKVSTYLLFISSIVIGINASK
jgi:hypothetical protein